jgi:curved DNA-binding protein CbpA
VSRDPYEVLGVSPDCSSEQLHDAYRRLVKLHHPDRNNGSAESTRRFQEIQRAYDDIRHGRARRPPPRTATPPPPAGDPAVEARMADLERELRDAKAAHERARRKAREAAREATGGPSREDLGYVETDDSFRKILSDVRDEVSEKVSGARGHPAVRRVSDLIDGLEDLTSRFGERPRK